MRIPFPCHKFKSNINRRTTYIKMNIYTMYYVFFISILLAQFVHSHDAFKGRTGLRRRDLTAVACKSDDECAIKCDVTIDKMCKVKKCIKNICQDPNKFVTCGTNFCNINQGMYCCNESCGICKKNGDSCKKKTCAFSRSIFQPIEDTNDTKTVPPTKDDSDNITQATTPPPVTGIPCGANSCDPTSQFCCNNSCGICSPIGGFCNKMFCGMPSFSFESRIP